MSGDAWFTLAVVVVTIGVLISERITPSLAILAASVLLFGAAFATLSLLTRLRGGMR